MAYDHSRVQLSVLPGQKRTSDYINASYIDGFQKFQAYIGSQGPLDDTFEVGFLKRFLGYLFSAIGVCLDKQSFYLCIFMDRRFVVN